MDKDIRQRVMTVSGKGGGCGGGGGSVQGKLLSKNSKSAKDLKEMAIVTG